MSGVRKELLGVTRNSTKEKLSAEQDSISQVSDAAVLVIAASYCNIHLTYHIFGKILTPSTLNEHHQFTLTWNFDCHNTLYFYFFKIFIGV